MRVKNVQKKDPIEVIESVCESLVKGELIMLAEDREQIENIIEGLISLLDAVDGDPDLEAEEDKCAADDDDPASSFIGRAENPSLNPDVEYSLGYVGTSRPEYFDQSPEVLSQGMLAQHGGRENDFCDDELDYRNIPELASGGIKE